MITHLDPAPNATDPEPFAGEDHPIRVITRKAAAGEWSGEDAAKIGALFDEMAPEWTAGHKGDRYLPLADAFERGQVAGARVLELGSGTGLGTEIVRRHFDEVIAMDLSMGMLQNAPDDLAPKANADASRLPLADNAVDVVVMVNMILFPAEIDRVLAPQGTVVWMNTSGEQTPIHLTAEQVDEALPGDWTGVASRYGTGTWAVLRRATS